MDLLLKLWALCSVVSVIRSTTMHCLLAASESVDMNTYFVRASESENNSCHSEPCLSLNEYARDAGKYFLDSATFVFMAGVHNLDVSISIADTSNITFIGSSDVTNDMNIEVFLHPQVNITWINCDNIEVRDLTFILSGESSYDDLFSALVFQKTTGFLCELKLLGNSSSLQSTAIFVNDSSQITVSNLVALKARSLNGAAIYAVESEVDFHGQNVFSGNIALDSGGAVALFDCMSKFYGNSTFFENFALSAGGAMVISGGVHFLSGDISFVENDASQGHGGAVSIQDKSSIVTFEDTSFIGNTAESGGALFVSGGSSSITCRNCKFIKNQARVVGGGAAWLSGKHNISGQLAFFNNTSGVYGGALALSKSASTHISGNIAFVSNTAVFGGAISITAVASPDHGVAPIHNIVGNALFCDNTATHMGGAIYSSNGGIYNFIGNISFIRNSAFSSLPGTTMGGAIHIQATSFHFSGSISFKHNEAISGLTTDFNTAVGGAIAANQGQVELVGEVTFDGNMASLDGGAIYSADSLVNITGTHCFIENFATRGGALAFSGDSKLIIGDPLKAYFTENEATSYGGAIFFEDQTTLKQCIYSNSTSIPTDQYHECFAELGNYSSSEVHLSFINNTAGRAGTVLYGGQLDKCKLYKYGGETDDCGNRNGAQYDFYPGERFLQITEIVSYSETISNISSDPLQVCFCQESDHFICSNVNVNLVKGKEHAFKVVIVGQNHGIVPSSVRAAHENGIEISPTQVIQSTGNNCTEIKYRLLSETKTTILVLFPDDGPCRDSGAARREVKITFQPCPNGFSESGSECVCDERLEGYTTNCFVDNESIERSSNTFWMDIHNKNGTFEGLILHNGSCPFDYCTDKKVNVTLNDLDIQCNNNHCGTLCGSCRDNFSVTFGTLNCKICGNEYLALILPFSLAGISLVAILLLLSLSVASGTINGLIFYANVIQANRSIFFPGYKADIVTVFIAWLNLDLGIETCFYNGMNVYAFTWLQFLFPFYVWFLIGLIVVVTHYSQWVTRILGSNPVAALATLLLLSYSKILQTIIMALSIGRLEYPDNSTSLVWFYDGSIPYFKRADHIVLGLFAVGILTLFFLPYTFLLLCAHCLQARSNWWVFSWVNKIKPLMDAYHAPYRKETRYWTGFLLLVRCVLFLTFSLMVSDSNVNLLSVTTASAVILALASTHGGIYKSNGANILEMSFHLNLCILAAASYHIRVTGSGSQTKLTYSSVGISLAIFVCLVLHHGYSALCKTSLGKRLPTLKLLAKFNVQRLAQENEEIRNRDERCRGAPNNLDAQAPTTSFIDIREYEPLLDTKRSS